MSAGKVYVLTQVGKNSPSNAWQTDASTPETPTEVKTNGAVSCIMDGKLFWADSAVPPTIESCTLAACATTTAPVLTIEGHLVGLPGCDAQRKELVWISSASASAVNTIYRAALSDKSGRPITSFSFPNDGASWQILGDAAISSDYPDRVFYTRVDSAAHTSSLYAVSTNVVNAAAILLVTLSGPDILKQLANDSLVLIGEFSSPSTYESSRIPLPNGILSGNPPHFLNGVIAAGVLDQTSFFGTVENSALIPPDALVSCPLSDCSDPTVIARGQAAASYFAQDEQAIYWTTSSQTSNLGFSIWKAAK